MSSEAMVSFLRKVAPGVEQSLQQNETVDIFQVQQLLAISPRRPTDATKVKHVFLRHRDEGQRRTYAGNYFDLARRLFLHSPHLAAHFSPAPQRTKADACDWKFLLSRSTFRARPHAAGGRDTKPLAQAPCLAASTSTGCFVCPSSYL